MNPKAAVPMEEFNQMTKDEQIAALCAFHECKPKVAKIHRDQYVFRKWNPHPPQRFVDWWGTDGVAQTEKRTDRAWSAIDAERAFNCEAVREVYREAKEIGIA
jgi:hypothetical protein